MLPNIWKRFDITLGIRNRIVGGIPTDPELIKGWIGANMPKVAEAERVELASKTVADLGAATEEVAEAMWTTFKRDEKGVYIEGRQVKAMFKEAANILRETLIKAEDKADAKKSRFTALRSKVAERLFIETEHIHILRDGKPLAKPDGNEERAIHVFTPQGKRSALKRVDFVSNPANVRFVVRHLAGDGLVDRDLMETLLDFSGWNGLGADRSQGNGLFDVVEIQPLD